MHRFPPGKGRSCFLRQLGDRLSCVENMRPCAAQRGHRHVMPGTDRRQRLNARLSRFLRRMVFKVPVSPRIAMGSSVLISAPVLHLVGAMRVERARGGRAMLDRLSPTNISALALALPTTSGDRHLQRCRFLLGTLQGVRTPLRSLDLAGSHLSAVLGQRVLLVRHFVTGPSRRQLHPFADIQP